MKKLLLLALLAPFCGQLIAQTVPPLINYQGQLSDAAGNPLPTADYTLTFSIHDAATGGSQVWGPQIFDGLGGQGHGPKIPVVQGFFNVLLGPVDTSGRSLADAFNAPNRWVEVKVGNNAPITPRQQILSAPFAIRAESAEKLKVPGGSATAATVTSSANVGIGTSTPRMKLEVAGNTKLGGTMTIGFSGNHYDEIGYNVGFTETPNSYTYLVHNPAASIRLGYLGDIEFRTAPYGTAGSALVLDNRMIIKQDGNVGIGTTAPEAKLDVAGTVKADQFVVGDRPIGEFAPAGMIVAFGGPNPPPGWLLCNGAAVSRTQYARLFAAIGTSWGEGDGSTTFNLPDLRGMFLRGVDMGRGQDPDRTARTAQATGGNAGDKVGSVQSDEFASHNHAVGDVYSSAGPGVNMHVLRSLGATHTVTNETAIGMRGGRETRPKNAYVHYIIKY